MRKLTLGVKIERLIDSGYKVEVQEVAVPKKKPTDKFPNLPGNVPVTQKMLYGVRNELSSKFMSLEHRMDSIDHRLDSIDHRMDSIDHRMESLEHKFESFKQEVKGDVHEIKGEVHRIALLVEEQNAKNNIVLDGLANLFSRQERIEQRMGET